MQYVERIVEAPYRGLLVSPPWPLVDDFNVPDGRGIALLRPSWIIDLDAKQCISTYATNGFKVAIFETVSNVCKGIQIQ